MIIRQINGALKTVLVNYGILEPIGNVIPSMAGKAVVWNAAGEAAADANRFQSLIEREYKKIVTFCTVYRNSIFQLMVMYANKPRW